MGQAILAKDGGDPVHSPVVHSTNQHPLISSEAEVTSTTEVAQQVKTLPGRANNQSLIPKIHCRRSEPRGVL